MRTLGAVALIGIILGLLFGGLPRSGATRETDRTAVFVVTRGGIETRTVEPADTWDVQPDGKLLIRTPADGGATEYYATATDNRSNIHVTFTQLPGTTAGEPGAMAQLAGVFSGGSDTGADAARNAGGDGDENAAPATAPAGGGGNSVTMYLVKLDTAAP